MDLLKNTDVTEALKKMRQSVTEQLSTPCEVFLWNPAYKGIDDYLLYLKQKAA